MEVLQISAAAPAPSRTLSSLPSQLSLYQVDALPAPAESFSPVSLDPKAENPGHPLFRDDGPGGGDDSRLTMLFVSIYALLVCSILFCITIGIIYCIRQRRRELANREQLQA
jgi:hypothetical protein